jgi:hypothetical protein
MQLTITIPDDVAAQLQNGAGDIARKILEFVAIQGYQSEALTVLVEPSDAPLFIL